MPDARRTAASRSRWCRSRADAILTTDEFVRRTLIVFGIALAVVAVWQLADLLLLVFRACVFAVVIRAGGDLAARYIPITPRWASMLVLVVVALVLGGLGYAVGDEVARQFNELRDRLPEALGSARDWVAQQPFGDTLLDSVDDASEEGVSTGGAVETATKTFGVVSHLIVLVLIALYLSFTPTLYLNGLVSLVPETYRPETRRAFEQSGYVLRGWLLGQAVSMLSVGVLTGIGLWLAGVPLAFILGIVAGLLEFIPILGPILAAVPGILLAFAVGPTTALYAVGVYFLVQQLEAGIIMPLAQKWAVQLAPALGLFAILVFGMMFGMLGVLFGTPLTVVLIALVKEFYVYNRPL